MTVTNGYCTVAQLADALGKPDASSVSPNQYANLEGAINSASRWIDQHCGRIFYVLGTATLTFTPSSWQQCAIADLSDSAGLVVTSDPGNVGTFSETWAAQDYELRPYDAPRLRFEAWPYTEIMAVYGRIFWPARSTFPARRSSLRLQSDHWGWAAVPDAVTRASIHLSEFLFKATDAPFGAAVLGDIGITRARVPSIVTDLLGPYRKYGVAGGPSIG